MSDNFSPFFGVNETEKKSERIFYFSVVFFIVALCLFSYTCYTSFLKDRVPRLSLNLNEKSLNSSLIKPQEPVKKIPTPVKTENTAVLEEMLAQQQNSSDKEETHVEKTAVSSEKEMIVETQKSVPEEKKEKEHIESEKNETTFVIKKAPLPDLIQGSFMESLPHFGNIKGNEPVFNPLSHISPMPEMIDKDGLPAPFTDKNKVKHFPFNDYKSSFVFPEKAPKDIPIIAILFSGVGMRESTTRAVTNALKKEVSLSFSPYSADLKTAVEMARQTGHETFLDLPMQEGVFPATDPGPFGVVKGLPLKENLTRLTSIMSSPVAFIGMTGTIDETFSNENAQMKTLLKQIEKSGLIYIDNNTQSLKKMSAFSYKPDIIIHQNLYRSSIRAQLEEAKKIAMEKGSVFIHALPLPIVILSIQDWMHENGKSFESETPPDVLFVPVSYLLEQRKK